MARAKNARLKTPGHECEYTYEQVQELKRCTTDPVYFIRKYIKIQHPIKGAVSFDLYDYQEEMINSFKDHRFSIILSARQSGKSIVSAAYLLWFAMFNFDKTVLIASNKNANAMEMILRIRFAYEELPFWIKPGITDDGWNKHTVIMDNGSRIESTATSEDSGRGMAISLLFLDEFAFVKPNIQDAFWTSISPTLSTGGSAIMASTPNGDQNIYAQTWRGAQMGTNGFHPIRVKWDEPPGRDQIFKDDEIGRIGQRRWDQEYGCVFLSSDTLLIDSLFLANISPVIEAIVPYNVVHDVILFEEIKPLTTYLFGVDPATGNGEDYSVISIFEFPSMRQVGEFRSNTMSSNDLYAIMKNILMYMENKGATIYYTVENNGVGQGLIALIFADEEPLKAAEFISEDGKSKYGITTTAKSKMRACVNLKDMLEKGNLEIKSKILLSELKSYVRARGSYAAQTGATDDCVSAVLMVLRLVEEIATYEQAAFDKLYAQEYATWTEQDWDGYEQGYDESDEGLGMIL